MKKITKFKVKNVSCWLMLVFFFVDVQAQSNTSAEEISPMRIGDTIPEALWNLPLEVVNHPNDKKVFTLNDYRDRKLIILNFWATYCKPCIKSIVRTDSILNQLNNSDAVLLPVLVYDYGHNALPFIKKMDWQVVSVVNDTTLNKVVLYNYLTGFGVAWFVNGKLVAVPSKKYITQDNIERAIRGEQLFIENRKGYPLMDNQSQLNSAAVRLH